MRIKLALTGIQVIDKKISVRNIFVAKNDHLNSLETRYVIIFVHISLYCTLKKCIKFET